MLFRFYIYSEKKDKAIEIFEEVIEVIEKNIRKREVIKVEPYWKISGIYVVEALIEPDIFWKDKIFSKFMQSIADVWKEFGNPTDELLASKEMENCVYMRNELSMVNIFLDNN